MATANTQLDTPAWFTLRTVVFSHGWYDLPPFAWLEDQQALEMAARIGDRPVQLFLTQPKKKLLGIQWKIAGRSSAQIERQALELVTETLGLNRDFQGFYKLAGTEYGWARKIGAGPFLRGASVFEDAVKMLATTNCSWSLTRQMIQRLVTELGEEGPQGTKVFPTPQAMSSQPVSFYREVIRTGYRSPFFKEFADRVASGKLNCESWNRFEGPTFDLQKQIRSVPGFGRYAAENLCKLLGRFDGLGLDSWCLKKFPQVHGPVRGDVTRAIERRYERFGTWKGLALWLDLTRDWHEKNPAKKPPDAF